MTFVCKGIASFRRGVFLLTAGCVLGACCLVFLSPRPVEAKSKPVLLFGTMEFKGTLKALPLWLSVLSRIDGNPGLLPSASLSAAKQAKAQRMWEELKAEASSLSPLEELKKINSFFNKWPYRLDRENWGVKDYWAVPGEFITHSGDCEDYSVIKYYALKELGFTPDKLRVVALKDTIRGIGHAVLAVYLDDDAYILDNVTNLVLPHARYQHYLPQYSVNEKYRWAHIAAKKKKTP